MSQNDPKRTPFKKALTPALPRRIGATAGARTDPDRVAIPAPLGAGQVRKAEQVEKLPKRFLLLRHDAQGRGDLMSQGAKALVPFSDIKACPAE
jgi:hypothetical protein